MAMLKKGDIVWCELFVTNKDENLQSGRRPCIVLGNKKSVLYSPIVTIVPLTSRLNKEKSIPTHCMVSTNDTVYKKLPKVSVALIEQMRAVSKTNCLEKIDSLNSSKIKELEKNIKHQLGIK